MKFEKQMEWVFEKKWKFVKEYWNLKNLKKIFLNLEKMNFKFSKKNFKNLRIGYLVKIGKFGKKVVLSENMPNILVIGIFVVLRRKILKKSYSGRVGCLIWNVRKILLFAIFKIRDIMEKS